MAENNLNPHSNSNDEFLLQCVAYTGEFEIRHNLKTPGSSGSE
jgi:hypothetical protein